RYRNVCRKCFNQQCKERKRRACSSLAIFQKPESATPIRTLYWRYRHRAKSRGILFELNFSDFEQIVSKECRYCGLPPSRVAKTQSGKQTQKYNGVDRRDSQLGYCLDNCVSCCWVCNRWKSDMSIDEFLAHTVKIYEMGVAKWLNLTRLSTPCNLWTV